MPKTLDTTNIIKLWQEAEVNKQSAKIKNPVRIFDTSNIQ
jgi:hypothetical protein